MRLFMVVSLMIFAALQGVGCFIPEGAGKKNKLNIDSCADHSRSKHSCNENLNLACPQEPVSPAKFEFKYSRDGLRLSLDAEIASTYSLKIIDDSRLRFINGRKQIALSPSEIKQPIYFVNSQGVGSVAVQLDAYRKGRGERSTHLSHVYSAQQEWFRDKAKETTNSPTRKAHVQRLASGLRIVEYRKPKARSNSGEEAK